MNFRITNTFLFMVLIASGVSAQVIWGGPGDPNGEFDGGLNDWTTVGLKSAVPDSAVNAVWVWDEDGSADMGLFANGNVAISSPSAANGAAIFNSDFLDNGGVDFGTGAAPSTPASNSGALISPIIDCSGRENVTVTFYQDYRNFLDNSSFLEVSNDGGSTFKSYEVNTNAIGNLGIPFANTFYRVNITEVAANQDSVVIRFVFDGDYYFWTIDDVAVIETPRLDVGLDNMWYSPTYASTPVTQLDAVDHEFAVEVLNLGTEDQYNVKVAVSVTTLTDIENPLFTDTVFVDTLLAYDTLFYIFDTIVQAETATYSEIGEYNLIYEILPEDDDLANRDNLLFERFRITDNQYSFDRGQISHLNTGNGRWVGNMYRTGSWEGEGNGVFTATKMYPSTSAASGMINGLVFRINDDVNENLDNFDFGADLTVPGEHPSLTTVGFIAHEVSSAGIQSVDLIDIETDEAGVTLMPNSRYLYIFQVDDGMRLGVDQSINYFQASTFVYVPGDRLYSGGYGESFSLVAGIDLEFASSTINNKLPESTLKVFPNPASQQYNVALDFEEATDVTVMLTGIEGKVYRMENLQSVTQLNKQYGTSEVAAGTYIVRILTDSGVSTQKLIIQK